MVSRAESSNLFLKKYLNQENKNFNNQKLQKVQTIHKIAKSHELSKTIPKLIKFQGDPCAQTGGCARMLSLG